MKPQTKKLGCFLLGATAIVMFLAPVALVGYIFYFGDDVYPDYTRQRPASKDIVGIWVLTPESAQDMIEIGKYKSNDTFINIKDDGTFAAVNLPDCAWSYRDGGWFFNYGKLASPSGKWSLSQESFNPFFDAEKEEIQVWDLNLPFDNLSGSLPPAPYPKLLNQSPPYIIHIPFGDADASDHIDFVKR